MVNVISIIIVDYLYSIIQRIIYKSMIEKEITQATNEETSLLS